MPRRASPPRRGFSLIELLVVVAIIALLLAILIPTLAGVRQRAATATCLAQSRTIATAVATFASSNAGRMPENRTLTAPDEHVTWRHRFLQEGYVAPAEAWVCPAHPGEPQSEFGQLDVDSACVGDTPASYALNGHVLWRRDTLDAEARIAESIIARPSHTILITETRARFPDLRVTNQLVAADDDIGGVYGFWHAGQGVYAFQDGHAETIAFLETGSPDCRWHNGRDLNQDIFNPQRPEERQSHDHPDWDFLVDEVYQR
ncbi:MAG: prepilin-type N-terminal cleavage/methylation domain-containing protein [Planctomycetota bacterium]